MICSTIYGRCLIHRCLVLTPAVAVMAHSYGAAKEAGGTTQMAGTWVGDVIIAADGLTTEQGHWALSCAAHHTVGTVGLVCHAGVGARAHHIRARL